MAHPSAAVPPLSGFIGGGPGLWRYQSVLPVPYDPNVSMGEGMTPLAGFGDLENVVAKLDFLLPTLSFKDRGASVLVSLARHLGVNRIVADSSGNAGTAVAAYAGRAGIDCEVFVPAGTSEAKLAALRSYRAQVRLVDGDRQATATEAVRRVEAGGVFYASHVYHPYFLEGVKTLIFEVWEQWEGRVPATIFLPVGNGSLLLGVWRGALALAAAGLCALPRLVAVQAANCAPVAAAFAAGANNLSPVAVAPTVAEGIAIARPPRGAEVLDAVRASGGELVTVTDAEVVEAQADLARRGLYVEPTSAAGWAAMLRPGWSGQASSGGALVVLTGAGSKSPAH